MSEAAKGPEAVLVSRRGEAAQMPQLGMRCDLKEIPDPIGGGKPVGWWLAATCDFEGSVQVASEQDGSEGQGRPIRSTASVALVVAEGRILGIVKPDSRNDPAVWFAAPLPSVRVEASGSQGVFKKRPSQIRLDAGPWSISVSEIARYYRNSNRMQTGQEASFLKALGQ